MTAWDEACGPVGLGDLLGRDEESHGRVALQIRGITLDPGGHHVVNGVIAVEWLGGGARADTEYNRVVELGSADRPGFVPALPEPLLHSEELVCDGLKYRVNYDMGGIELGDS